MSNAPFGYLPTIFGNLLQPIAALFEAMDKLNCKPPNDVQAASSENGYAASIVVLCAMVIESACGLARQRKKNPPSTNALDVLGYLQTPRDLIDAASDIFIVRNAVAQYMPLATKALEETEHLASMPNWTKNSTTQADVRIFILDTLYSSLPRPPFSDEETDAVAERLYGFVFQQSEREELMAA